VRFRSFAYGCLTLAITASVVSACSSKAQLAGQGGECNVATDCQPGLVCEPQKSGSSLCSNNLGSIQQLPPTPDSGAPQAASDASADDAGSGPSDDAGSPTTKDTGAPPADTGAPPSADASSD
jgi:hypothetical protein